VAQSDSDTGEVRYLLKDGQGSTRVALLWDADAPAVTVDETYDYDAFGVPINDTPADPAVTIGFTGHRWDPGTGLLYCRARYYDPTIGRFTTMDPLAGLSSDPLTLHRYVYCRNNPVMYTDPTGEFSFSYVGQFVITTIQDKLREIDFAFNYYTYTRARQATVLAASVANGIKLFGWRSHLQVRNGTSRPAGKQI
jgi:RHS repeat-associated protein